MASGHHFWKYHREVPAADGSKTKLGFSDRFFLHNENHRTVHASLISLGIELAIPQAFRRFLRQRA